MSSRSHAIQPGHRLALSLLIACLLHLALLSIPLPLPSGAKPANHPIQVTIVQNANNKETASKTDSDEDNESETAANMKTDAGSAPAKESQPDKSDRQRPKPDTPEAETIKPNEVTTKPIQPPHTTNGAKERSTVFDPRLAEKLARERNKVRKFESGDTEYMTTTGTFVQEGDRCWEVKKLLPGDIDSNLTQDFKIKCTKRRRSQEDIDRLARKYGIP